MSFGFGQRLVVGAAAILAGVWFTGAWVCGKFGEGLKFGRGFFVGGSFFKNLSVSLSLLGVRTEGQEETGEDGEAEVGAGEDAGVTKGEVEVGEPAAEEASAIFLEFFFFLKYRSPQELHKEICPSGPLLHSMVCLIPQKQQVLFSLCLLFKGEPFLFFLLSSSQNQGEKAGEPGIREPPAGTPGAMVGRENCLL